MSLGEAISSGSATTKFLWHLNGNANDSSGNSVNGTVTGAVSTSQGRFGGGYTFDGSSGQYIDFGANANFPVQGTFVGWFKFDDFTTGSAGNAVYMLHKRDATAGNGTWSVIYFNASATPTTTPAFYFYDGTSFKSKRVTKALTAGVWYNFIWVVDIANAGASKCFINGEKQTLTLDETSGTYAAGGTHTCRLGYSANAGASFKGTADEIFVESGLWSDQKCMKYYAQAKGMWATL